MSKTAQCHVFIEGRNTPTRKRMQRILADGNRRVTRASRLNLDGWKFIGLDVRGEFDGFTRFVRSCLLELQPWNPIILPGTRQMPVETQTTHLLIAGDGRIGTLARVTEALRLLDSQRGRPNIVNLVARSVGTADQPRVAIDLQFIHSVSVSIKQIITGFQNQMKCDDFRIYDGMSGEWLASHEASDGGQPNPPDHVVNSSTVHGILHVLHDDVPGIIWDASWELFRTGANLTHAAGHSVGLTFDAVFHFDIDSRRFQEIVAAASDPKRLGKYKSRCWRDTRWPATAHVVSRNQRVLDIVRYDDVKGPSLAWHIDQCAMRHGVDILSIHDELCPAAHTGVPIQHFKGLVQGEPLALNNFDLGVRPWTDSPEETALHLTDPSAHPFLYRGALMPISSALRREGDHSLEVFD